MVFSGLVFGGHYKLIDNLAIALTQKNNDGSYGLHSVVHFASYDAIRIFQLADTNLNIRKALASGLKLKNSDGFTSLLMLAGEIPQASNKDNLHEILNLLIRIAEKDESFNVALKEALYLDYKGKLVLDYVLEKTEDPEIRHKINHICEDTPSRNFLG